MYVFGGKKSFNEIVEYRFSAFLRQPQARRCGCCC
jgi:hypothetical protein